MKVHSRSPKKFNLPILKDTENLQVHKQREIKADKKKIKKLLSTSKVSWVGPIWCKGTLRQNFTSLASPTLLFMRVKRTISLIQNPVGH